MIDSLVIFTIISILSPAQGVVPCNSTGSCEKILSKGSQCRYGFCTNPFQRGCLGTLLESDEYAQKFTKHINPRDGGVNMQAWRRRLVSFPRTCNSEDESDAANRGICSRSKHDYQEVRILSQNWESAFIQSWMMQIIYSELLGVPSTLESGMKNKIINFYDETNRMDYGTSYDYESLENAYEAGGDCAIYNDVNEKATGDDNYIPCAHAVMEIWSTTNSELVKAQKLQIAAPTMSTRMVGFQGWHITKSTIIKDPSLATIFGMRGESNRQKIAETFKRPTTWIYYCSYISPNNCTISNHVATRPPANDTSEDGLYFSLGSYNGYFRATEKNNCAETKTCTGHFMDYPCDWTSYSKQQIKHLNVALESGGDEASGGYTYSEMVDIWNAANATKSDLIGMWFSPDPTHQLFQGSGFDFIPVLLPRVSQECIENRVDVLKRCDTSATEFELFGDEKGACGAPSVVTQKVAVGNMEAMYEESENPTSRMSPAYGVYKRFSITEFEVGEIMDEWIDRGQDKDNFDLRFATCQWMVENLEDIIEKFVPPSHPRSYEAVTNLDALTIAALVLSALSIFVTIGTVCGLVYKQRRSTLRVAAQTEFLALLLIGLFLVSIGSLLLTLEPSKGTCVGSIWMINVGYTMQLVPTMIRVSAIVKIVEASRRFRVITVDKKRLLRTSIGVSAIAALYCMLWTIFDPPYSQASWNLSDSKNQYGETIVSVSNSCNSKSKVWFMVMFAIQGFLLIGASVLAWQMRSVPNIVNDSAELAVMIYSQFMLLVLRFLAYIFSGALPGISNSLQQTRSLLCSIDVICSIVIFFSRFFLVEEKRESSFLNFAHKFYCNANDAQNLQQNPQALATSPDTKNAPNLTGLHNSLSLDGHDTTNPCLTHKKEVFAEEEKEEEDSMTIMFRTKVRSIALPKWVVDKYGQVEVHELKPSLKQGTKE